MAVGNKRKRLTRQRWKDEMKEDERARASMDMNKSSKEILAAIPGSCLTLQRRSIIYSCRVSSVKHFFVCVCCICVQR